MKLKPRASQAACPLCHDDLVGDEHRCGECATTYHPGCYDELGGCGTLGCAGRGRRRVFTRVERPEPRARSHAVDGWLRTGGLAIWAVLEAVFWILSILFVFC